VVSPSILSEKYRVLAHLGTGATGIVYEAENLVTGRRVALKLLEKGAVAGAAESERIFREARAAGQLESRHIAQVLDAGIDAEERGYIVLELLRGADLGAVLAREGPLEPTLALRLVGQGCAGVAKAHAAGILHRDIKPANLFVTREDEQLVTKLLDFGLAKAMKPEALGAIGQRSLTAGHLVVGTPLYMSPEQARSAKTIDARSDVWSLGVVLYEALTGKTPHEKEAGLVEMMLAICSKQAKISERAPGLPSEVGAIVDRALALEPADRFESAEEMMNAICALVGSLAVDAAALRGTLGHPSSVPRSGPDSATIVATTPEATTGVRTLTLAASSVVVETSVRDGYVLACIRGRVGSADEAHASNTFMADALSSTGLRALLLDARRADGTTQGHASLWDWLRQNRAFDRFAMLVESSALRRGFNAQAAEYSVDARAFHAVDEAEAWLRGKR
jgi:serine/threonine protein kinase